MGNRSKLTAPARPQYGPSKAIDKGRGGADTQPQVEAAFAAELPHEYARLSQCACPVPSNKPAVSRCRDRARYARTPLRDRAIVLGGLLLAAAALKLYGVHVSAVPRVGAFANPQIWLPATMWELVLGVWLLSGAQRALAWLAASLTFLAFAGVSAYLGWAGVGSCGCLGAVRVSPWYAFGVDVAALALLTLGRPRFDVDFRGVLRGTAPIALGTIVVLGAVAGISSIIFGSPSAALARFRGESITVEPTTTDVGDAVAGESKRFSIRLTNYADQHIRIVGGTTTCSCIATESLPMDLAPGATGAVDVEIQFRGAPRIFRHRFSLLSDSDKHSKIVAYFAGRVIAAHESGTNQISARGSR